MTKIRLSYFNYEHGGMINASSRGEVPGGYDFSGLVEVMGEEEDGEEPWPHLIAMGEGDYYEYWGGAGMWDAAEAMREAGGRAYVPLLCDLPRQWGPFAPVYFFDAQTLIVKRFFDHRAPDFAMRNRNVLQVRAVGSKEYLFATVTHGDLYSAIHKQTDAEEMRWIANEKHLGVVFGDFNETLSGPDHEPTDLEDRRIYDKPWHFLNRLEGQRGRPDRPYKRTTVGPDVLAGYWDEERGERVEGIGFVDAMEQAGITTPTNKPLPNGRQCTAIDHIFLNSKAAKRAVPGSARVHEPLDPDNPRSDHKRLSVTIEM